MDPVTTANESTTRQPPRTGRPYDGTLRRERAAETRERILVAGSELFGLFHEGDGQRRRRVIDQRLRDPFTAVAHHDHDLLRRELGQRVEDVEDHRSAAQTVQGFRTRRTHPCPLAGGEHHSRKRTVGHAV